MMFMSCRATAFGVLNALCKLAAVLSSSVFSSFVGVTKAVPILLSFTALVCGGLVALKLPDTREKILQWHHISRWCIISASNWSPPNWSWPQCFWKHGSYFTIKCQLSFIFIFFPWEKCSCCGPPADDGIQWVYAFRYARHWVRMKLRKSVFFFSLSVTVMMESIKWPFVF